MDKDKKKKQQAPRVKLQPGEDSIERVVDALPPRGPYEAKITVRLWDGRLYRPTIRAKTKGEFRRKAVEKRDIKLNAGATDWDKGKKMTDFIDTVATPAIEAARLRPNTRSRYDLAISQARARLDGLAIGEAVKFRTLERVLQTIGQDHGAESARQARTVVSKYVLDQLIREGVLDHNPLRGISIDLGTVKKGHKPEGGHALTDEQYDAVIEHLLTRDTSVPIPPGTDRRHTSIIKHDNTVALALLQAATGLRISEALALTKAGVTITDEVVAVTVTAGQSKTHRGRTMPLLDPRIERYWRERLGDLRMADPLIPAPGDKRSHWRTDNAVKACAALYKDVGAQLDDNEVAAMRSHGWRTVLNNRAIARGVPAEIRSAYFGHTEALNQSNYTDLTDVSAMRAALNLDEESGTQNGT
ncbi:tyrosine-type recombinase/integrase [Corynebacterium auriscanis]|uniref:tyrosine-type recombinase/integrase n=1 Tax=Corynebacterium auriscanis TaxID=99807 RepID=UPI003CE8F017